MSDLIPDNKRITESSNRAYCQYCSGYCCYRLKGSTLFITAIDINRIARHFHITDGEVRKRYIEGKNTFKIRDDGSCIFLGNGKLSKRCTIHPARPQQCRDFPYDDPCPYLQRADLLKHIYPKIVASMKILPRHLHPLRRYSSQCRLRVLKRSPDSLAVYRG